MIPAIAVWLAAIIAHIALTVRAVHRVWPADSAHLDARIFASVLGTIGSLSIVLHTTALTAGLGLSAGIIALAIWHAGVWWLLRRGVKDPVLARAPGAGAFTVPEQLAGAVLLAILLTWVGLAAASSDILGPDAAHYHVPYAINLAAGASPFSLPATPHLYPMAASVVSAWFMLPTGDPLIIDLALAMPFALLLASLNLLFRCGTSRSGLAWASWLGLALFSTRMFHSSAQGSADLWFAAAFVALVAAIVHVWSSAGRWSLFDVALGAAAAGLLLGSKTTGAPATGLILGAAAVVSLVRRLLGGPRVTRPSSLLAAVAIAALVCAGAGGIWLVRNWIQYGSPLAPAGLSIAGLTIFPGETFQQTTYLSVLGEMETTSFHLGPRVQFFIEQWFGGWYLPALWPIALFVVDLVVSARQCRTTSSWWSRVTLFVITVGAGTVLIWLLIGAPWTGLERSRGLTLRYVLPIAALLPLVALMGLFPFAFPWYRRASARAIGLAVLVAVVSWLWWQAATHPDPAEPAAFAPGLTAIGFLVATVLTTMFRMRSGRRGAVVLLVMGAAVWWAPAIARADRTARVAAQARLDDEDATFASGQPIADPWRHPFLALRAAQRAEGTACTRERFFSLARFDEPVALQPPGFGNQVFYAGRDVEQARQAGPIGACDYIITTPALSQTDKGQALAAALAGGATLRQLAATKELVLLTVR